MFSDSVENIGILLKRPLGQISVLLAHLISMLRIYFLMESEEEPTALEEWLVSVKLGCSIGVA